MTVKRMDNVGIVVADIDDAIAFFSELGLQLEGRAPIHGHWAVSVTGLRNMRVEIAMLRTPEGHRRLEISRFLAPQVARHERAAAGGRFAEPQNHWGSINATIRPRNPNSPVPLCQLYRGVLQTSWLRGRRA